MSTPPVGINRPTDYMVMRAFLWSGIVVVASVVIAGAWLLGYIPPPSPDMSAEQFLAFIQGNRHGVLAGGAVCILAWSLWSTWPVPMIVLLRKMEGTPFITYASIAILGSTSAIITLIAVGWSLQAFRVENAQIAQAFNDFAFYMFLYTWPPFGLWMILIATAIFRDINPQPIYPRWFAYYNILSCFGMAPATLIGFFKTGPLAYDGIISFWLFVTEFLVWMVVTVIVTSRAYTRLAQQEPNAASAPAMSPAP